MILYEYPFTERVRSLLRLEDLFDKLLEQAQVVCTPGAGFGVRVGAVAPGMIETPMTSAVPEEARQRALAGGNATAPGAAGTLGASSRTVIGSSCRIALIVSARVFLLNGDTPASIS